MSKPIGVLNKIRYFVPNTVMKMLYYTMIHPYVTYSLEAWYNAPLYISNKISILQKRAVRSYNSLSYRDHTANSFKAMKLLKPSEQFRQQIGLYIYTRQLSIPNYDNSLMQSLRT